MRKRIMLWLMSLLAVLAALFSWNGVNPSWKHPERGVLQNLADTLPKAGTSGSRPECRVLAINLAKLGFHKGGFEFAEDFEVRKRLERIAELIRETKADIVCLSEVVFEGGPSGVNQVKELAAASGITHWSYADNYRFGFSFYGIRSGNAILSRFPLTPLLVQQLPGAAAFWNPVNRRRLLLAEAMVNGQLLRIGSVRNDSFDLKNNELQSKAILDGLKSEHVLLAGDFNAEPGDPSMLMFKGSGLFSGSFEGPATFPAEGRRLDYVLGPRAWYPVEERVIELEGLDHLAVLARFRLP